MVGLCKEDDLGMIGLEDDMDDLKDDWILRGGGSMNGWPLSEGRLRDAWSEILCG